MLARHNPNFSKSASNLISMALLTVLLAGCNLPYTAPATPTLITLPTPTPVPTVVTPTAIPPSPTPNLIVTATPQTSNIVFATGTTAAVEQGNIKPGQIQAYTLSAGQSQPMILILTSPNNDATLAVYEPNGNALLDPAKKWTNWQWLLPKTEVYTIQVIGGATSENFTLTAKVAARIKFDAGATSATVSGSTQKGYVISYAVSATANQTMTVTLTAAANSAWLDIFGLAFGQLLLSPDTKATTWTGALPSTQDYVIEIIPNNGQVVNYSLTVTIH
jgi:hypothetical protein